MHHEIGKYAKIQIALSNWKDSLPGIHIASLIPERSVIEKITHNSEHYQSIIQQLKTIPIQERDSYRSMVAGSYYEGECFFFCQRIFSQLLPPYKTSLFFKELLQTVDQNTSLLSYPFDTYSVNNEYGTPDGVILKKKANYPWIPLTFEYTAQRSKLSEKVQELENRFRIYQSMFPSYYDQSKLIIVTPPNEEWTNIKLPVDIKHLNSSTTYTKLSQETDSIFFQAEKDNH